MKYLIVVISLLAVSIVSADTVVFIGKNGSTIVRKDVVVNPDASTLDAFKVQYPNLTWSVGRDTDKLPLTPTAKERYQNAVTVDDKLSVMRDVLNLN